MIDKNKLPKIKNYKFESCNEKIGYSLKHQKIPIKLSAEMAEALEHLLWYIPNINSLQALKNELVSSIAFEDFVFGIVKEVMGLKKEDVAFVDNIDERIVEFYSKSVYKDTEKLILTQADNESQTESLCRHTRNALAHGCFNIVDNLLVAFDFKTIKNNKNECSAIIIIKPKNLLKALEALQSEVTSERLAQISLQRTGYYVERFKSDDGLVKFDFYAKKDNLSFAIEIKKYKVYETLPEEEVDKLVKQFNNIFENLIPVLFIDTSLLTEISKNRLLDEKVIILDIKNIKKMLNKRDMIMEIFNSTKS